MEHTLPPFVLRIALPPGNTTLILLRLITVALKRDTIILGMQSVSQHGTCLDTPGNAQVTMQVHNKWYQWKDIFRYTEENNANESSPTGHRILLATFKIWTQILHGQDVKQKVSSQFSTQSRPVLRKQLR